MPKKEKKKYVTLLILHWEYLQYSSAKKQQQFFITIDINYKALNKMQ